ncbi:hypothetical protein LEP1GSC074_1969 [Leptospira noguchii str. Hook]|nr:hypothetical protein LEP1GSC074_1969 [Leptospira noguchii str. Hook]
MGTITNHKILAVIPGSEPLPYWKNVGTITNHKILAVIPGSEPLPD